ncbi:hypothetical protein BSU04_26175 [Caballeronia sordidicola]|uniref:Uncharacterized protein n=1 Tax=Caballeronia sordidicola TaxID=196367 RepID=A0A226WWZ6_CABSO|nr:hypothetical protein BSU04_26175 [Caballeronia sordidicola]
MFQTRNFGKLRIHQGKFAPIRAGAKTFKSRRNIVTDKYWPSMSSR